MDKDIFVTLPLDDIIALRGFMSDYAALCADIKQLQRRLDGCYTVQSDVLLKLNELARQLASVRSTTTKADDVSSVKKR